MNARRSRLEPRRSRRGTAVGPVATPAQLGQRAPDHRTRLPPPLASAVRPRSRDEVPGALGATRAVPASEAVRAADPGTPTKRTPRGLSRACCTHAATSTRPAQAASTAAPPAPPAKTAKPPPGTPGSPAHRPSPIAHRPSPTQFPTDQSERHERRAARQGRNSARPARAARSRHKSTLCWAPQRRGSWVGRGAHSSRATPTLTVANRSALRQRGHSLDAVTTFELYVDT